MIRDMKRYEIKGANVSVSIFCVYVRVCVFMYVYAVGSFVQTLIHSQIHEFKVMYG